MSFSNGETNKNAVEWALRVCQSMAFCIHGVLGVTEPFTGCVQSAFRDTHGSMPKWFWPVAGLLLWTVAGLNFSSNDAVVLGVQAYICSFHMGGFFYHLRLGHHPVVGIAPTVFAVMAVCVVGIRIGSSQIALLGWVACTILAFGLSRVLVTPPSSSSSSGDANADTSATTSRLL